MKSFTAMVLALGTFSIPSVALAQNDSTMPGAVSRAGAFQHLSGPRFELPENPDGITPLRQFCPERIDTCRKYWEYTINFVANYSIPLRDKELLILRTAWLSRGDYIWGRHNLMGQDAGLTIEEIARVAMGPKASGWSEFDALLLRTADELHINRFVSQETWDGLAGRYTEEQLREVVLIVGNYTQLAMFQNTLGVQLPPEIEGLPVAQP